jgi:hypothetical protein
MWIYINIRYFKISQQCAELSISCHDNHAHEAAGLFGQLRWNNL